jgi:hypothetical protein
MPEDSRRSNVPVKAGADKNAADWRAQLELYKHVSEAALKRAKIATWAAIVSLALVVIWSSKSYSSASDNNQDAPNRALSSPRGCLAHDRTEHIRA